MRSNILLGTFLALALIAVQSPPAWANHCADPSLGTFAALSNGETKAWGTFTDTVTSGGNTAGDHVPDWWSASDNYSSGCGRSISTDNEVIRQSIDKGATNTGNGDVSIFKAFAASGSQSYSATASANLWNMEGTPFRGGLKIAAWDTDTNPATQLDEWKKYLCPTLNTDPSCDYADGDAYVTLTLGPKTLPAGTDVVKVAFRANGNLNSAYGVAGLERLTFTRDS